MASHLDTIRRVYEALARGDIPGVIGLLAENVSWTEAEGFPYGGTYSGPGAVLEGVFMKLGTEWEGFSAVPKEFVVQGGTVVALGQCSGRYKGTSKGFSAPFAHVWNLEGEKIVKFRQFTDTAVVEEALKQCSRSAAGVERGPWVPTTARGPWFDRGYDARKVPGQILA